MKKFAWVTLLICGCVGPVAAQTQAPLAAAPAKAPSVAQSVKQLEQDWAAATKAADTDKLNEILGDDWVAIGPDGSKESKTTWIADLKGGSLKLTSYENGPMDVKVLGNVVLVHGSDTEKSTYKGKDTSGKYVWMDVFVIRAGKWVAVRSQTAQVK